MEAGRALISYFLFHDVREELNDKLQAHLPNKNDRARCVLVQRVVFFRGCEDVSLRIIFHHN